MKPDKTGQEQAANARDGKGRFVAGTTGNPNGRPCGTGKAGKLADALGEYEKKTGKSFLEAYFGKAFEDPATMRDLAGRLYPALKAVEGSLDMQHKILNIFGLKELPDAK